MQTPNLRAIISQKYCACATPRSNAAACGHQHETTDIRDYFEQIFGSANRAWCCHHRRLSYRVAGASCRDSEDVAARSGPIELLTVGVYLAALGYILLKGAYRPLKWVFWLTFLLMLRELDFDSRFTDAKITKSEFLWGADVPVVQLVYGYTLLVIVAWVVLKVTITHGAGFWTELRAGTDLALWALLAMMAAVLSKLVDGGRRKLGYIGIELNEQHETGLVLFEEFLELSLPVMIMVGTSLFLRRYRRRE